MRKIASLIGGVLSIILINSTIVFAQGEMDAYKLSRNDINGTARYVSMGGAFGALGGDVTSMTTNPAGLGIYRSSEIVATLSLNMNNAKTDWNGSPSSANKTKFHFDNFAYVAYIPTARSSGILSWNVGIAYNRLKSFDRRINMSGTQSYSVADYIASLSTNFYGEGGGVDIDDLTYVKGSYDPYFDNKKLSWLPILGFEGGFFTNYSDTDTDYHSAFGYNENNSWVTYEPSKSFLNLNESGSVDQYNFSLSTNVSDIVYLGATVSVTDINYNLYSEYSETFGGVDDLYLNNVLSTEGSGYAVNAGAIVRPVDFLRLGVAYNSPTWYRMTDYYQGEAGSYNTFYSSDPTRDAETPEKQMYEYKLRTPDRWIFSLAGIIGKTALVSLDYELTNYKNMALFERNDLPYFANEYIEQDFTSAGTLKIGAEIKVTSQFAVRAGASWADSPMRTELKENKIEVYTAGTIPHFVVDRGVSSYSVGFGYRFTPNFYGDIACVYKRHKEDVYAFSNTYHKIDPIKSDAASLNANTTRIAVTFGYKF